MHTLKALSFLLIMTLVIAIPAYSAPPSFPISQAQTIVELFKKELGPLVDKEKGAKLEISFITDLPNLIPMAAASAEREGNTWLISIWGGASLPERMTPDGFLMMLCHEVGHHVGGEPLKLDEHGNKRWSSVEGHADYFASAVCAKHFLPLLPRRGFVPDPAILTYCSSYISSAADAALCARNITAAKELEEGLYDVAVDWKTSDPTVVTETLGLKPDAERGGAYDYPARPCQIENLRRGALCQKLTRPSARDVLGLSGAARYCEDEVAKRPACWYADI